MSPADPMVRLLVPRLMVPEVNVNVPLNDRASCKLTVDPLLMVKLSGPFVDGHSSFVVVTELP